MRLKIRFKKLAQGYETAFFDIHINGARKTESTGTRFKAKPNSFEERRERKEQLNTVEVLASRRRMELLNGINDLEVRYEPADNFMMFLDEFIAHHPIQEIKKFHAMRTLLTQYAGKKKVACFEINERFLKGFVHFLEDRLNGESPSNYFAKLKQIIKAAVSEGVLLKNPADGIRVKRTQYIQKDVLNFHEIGLIAQTPLGNEMVKLAFLFCIFTGLRYCDVKALKWENILTDELKLVQQKTKIAVTVPLFDNAKSVLPQRGKNHELVFDLPSHTSCQKWVKRLVRDAGLDKKISWHCGRHTFGTNLIACGNDVTVVSKLLGHNSLVNTQRYVKVNQEMKAKAIATFPTISVK